MSGPRTFEKKYHAALGIMWIWFIEILVKLKVAEKSNPKSSQERNDSALPVVIDSRYSVKLYLCKRYCTGRRPLISICRGCIAAVSSQGNVVEKDTESIILSAA